MKFIADSMLGRLAKWLRILGYDTLYHTDIDDSLLLRIAREDGRVILTRDTRLIKVKGLKDFIFISDDNPTNQLKQLFNTGIINESPMLLSRCVHCNSILYSVSSNEAEGVMPDFALWREKVVRQCSTCGRIYWKGSHPEKIKERLKEMLS
ncbi:MAG: Mut7-C RNAse domain-containing protein [Nitrospirota bacterium]